MPAIPNSGAISLADFAAEFGGTAPHSMSEYYRDGGNVPSNNSNVPTSGAFRFGQMRGAINAIINTLANTTNVNLATVFGDNWASSVPKEIIIPSGVTIGGTGTSDALTAPSGMGGTLTITNAGNIIGFGGASGGNGGNAIRIASAGITVDNTGFIAGGGGGGGAGGTGGQGGNGGNGTQHVSGRWVRNTNTNSCGSRPSSCPAYCYCFQNGTYNMGEDRRMSWYGYACGTSSGGTGGAGGAGGAGGIGQGYNQSLTTGLNGSSGSTGGAGGTNAGSGGSGGLGGTGSSGASYGSNATAGTAGSNGGSGSNGSNVNSCSTSTSGSAGGAGSTGGAGGLAGAAVIYTAAYTMNNTGTLAGAA